MDLKKLVMEKIDSIAVARYLCAGYGETFGLYADGDIAVGTNIGNEIAENERPIICIRCPGISNIETSSYTESWTELVENGDYRDLGTGEILTIEECIFKCAEYGDMIDDVSHLQNLLLNSE